MINPGKYTATISDYGIRRVKAGPNAGKPAATIKWAVKVGAATESVYWQGSFVEGKAREITMESLAHCGLQVQNLAALADGPGGKALDMNKELEVDVIHETDPNGKLVAKVKWVNPIGGKGFQDLMDKKEFAFFIGDMQLQGSFVEAQRNAGIKPATPAYAPPAYTPPAPAPQYYAPQGSAVAVQPYGQGVPFQGPAPYTPPAPTYVAPPYGQQPPRDSLADIPF